MTAIDIFITAIGLLAFVGGAIQAFRYRAAWLKRKDG